MDKLYKLLSDIRKQPERYLERASLTYLNTFLSGYAICMDINTDIHVGIYPGFMEFIQKKFNIYLTLNSMDIIEIHCSNEQEAFNRYFELLDEFLEKTKGEEEYNG